MRGERIVYDMDTGVANVDPKAGERVKALITPGSGSENGPKPVRRKRTRLPSRRPIRRSGLGSQAGAASGERSGQLSAFTFGG